VRLTFADAVRKEVIIVETELEGKKLYRCEKGHQFRATAMLTFSACVDGEVVGDTGELCPLCYVEWIKENVPSAVVVERG